MFLKISVIKIFVLLLLASFKFAFAVPISLYRYKLSLLETIVITSAGGIAGILFFAFLSNLIINLWRKFYVNSKLDKQVRNTFNKIFNTAKKKKQKKKVFTRRNKMIIKIKRDYGLIGLALITPSLISIPVGTFIILRYFPNQKKSITYLIFSVLIWSVIFSCFFNFFVKK